MAVTTSVVDYLLQIGGCGMCCDSVLAAFFMIGGGMCCDSVLATSVMIGGGGMCCDRPTRPLQNGTVAHSMMVLASGTILAAPDFLNYSCCLTSDTHALALPRHCYKLELLSCLTAAWLLQCVYDSTVEARPSWRDASR